MKLADLQARILQGVRDKYGAEPGLADTVNEAVKLTIEGIGFHFATDGTICDPRPEQRFMPAGMEAKWGGGSRRRRGPQR